MKRELLTIDGIANLALGILLIVFPSSLVRVLGVPGSGGAFYANILGGVLFGIGVALLIERYRPSLKLAGLGLGGAICINLCGGIVLSGWLVFGGLRLTTAGYIVMWALVLFLVTLSSIELCGELRSRDKAE